MFTSNCRTPASSQFRSIARIGIATLVAAAAHCHAQTGCSSIGVELAPLTATFAEQKFGWGAAISDDGQTVALSSGGSTASQEVVIYQRGNNDWTPAARIPSPIAGATSGHWSYGLEMSGNGRTLLVLPSTSPVAGAVVIDQNADGTWPTAGFSNILPSSGYTVSPAASNSRFAQWADIDFAGTTAIVGEPATGTVKVYTRTPGTPSTPAGIWQQQAVLAQPAPVGAISAAPGSYGFSVRLSSDGSTAATCGLAADGNSRLYIFKRTGTTWAASATLTPANLANRPHYLTLSGDGNTVVGLNSLLGIESFRCIGGTWGSIAGAFASSGLANSIALNFTGEQAADALSSDVRIHRQQGNAWVQAESVSTSPFGALNTSPGRCCLSRDGRTLVAALPLVTTNPSATPQTNAGRVFVVDIRSTVSVVSQPASQNVAQGASISLTFGITTSLTPRAEWRRNNVIIADGPGPHGIIYSGATTPTLTIANIPASENGGVYNCTILNACSPVHSNSATVNVLSSGTACLADIASDSADTQFNPNGSVGPEDLEAFVNAFISGC